MTIAEARRIHDSPAEQIAWARRALASAKSAEWPEAGGKLIAEVMEELWFALDIAEAIEKNEVHPAAEYPELADEPQAGRLAMERAADEVAGWAEELIRLFPAAAPQRGTAGNLTHWPRLPLGRERAVTVALCAAAMVRTMDSPRPCPSW
jgi:hypothetical protein